MLAAQITAPRTLELREVPTPEPEAGQVRVRIAGCGICASNVPPWEGRPWFDYPMPPGFPGHEAWGEVDATAPDVQGVQPGQRVAILSQHAYAEYDISPAELTIPLPENLNGSPVPAEPVGCAMNVFRRMDVRSGQTVAIVGVGFLGAMLIGLCREAGARVIAISRRHWALELAGSLGAHAVVSMHETHQAIEDVAALTDGIGEFNNTQGWCERVIECTGKEAPLRLASEICAVGGRLGIAGFHQDGDRQIDMQLWNWRGLEVINTHERAAETAVQGMRDGLATIAAGRLDLRPLLTHRYSFRDLADGLDAASNRPEGFLKGYITTGA